MVVTDHLVGVIWMNLLVERFCLVWNCIWVVLVSIFSSSSAGILCSSICNGAGNMRMVRDICSMFVTNKHMRIGNGEGESLMNYKYGGDECF